MNQVNPIYISEIGVVECKEDGIEVTYEDLTVRFSYQAYLGSNYRTKEDLIHDQVKSSSYSHYEKLVDDKIKNAISHLDEDLLELIGDTIWYYYSNNIELFDKAMETFDAGKSRKSAHRIITKQKVKQHNITTAHKLIEEEPLEFVKFYQEQTKIGNKEWPPF